MAEKPEYQLRRALGPLEIQLREACLLAAVLRAGQRHVDRLPL